MAPKKKLSPAARAMLASGVKKRKAARRAAGLRRTTGEAMEGLPSPESVGLSPSLKTAYQRINQGDVGHTALSLVAAPFAPAATVLHAAGDAYKAASGKNLAGRALGTDPVGPLPSLQSGMKAYREGRYGDLAGHVLAAPLTVAGTAGEAIGGLTEAPPEAHSEVDPGKDRVQRVRDDKTLGEKHQDMLAEAGIGGAAKAAPGPQYATKTSTTVRKGIDLEKMGGFGPKHFMRASDQQKVALRDQAKAQAETNQQLAQEYMKSPQEREAAAEEYEDQRMAVQHQVQQVRTRLAQMEREAAKEVVDPDRYWDNADIGKKMAYITAAADAGAAAGFMGRAGGANPILTMASRMIVADINAQKSNIAFAAGRRGEVRGLLGSLQRQVKDIGTAEALTYKRLAMDTSDRLKGIALQSSSPSLKARAEAAAGALDQKAMQMGNQAAAMMADRISQTTQRVPFRAGGAGGKKKDDFEQRKYDALAGLNRLGEFIKLADASWVEALKFAAPRDISARAEQYTTTRTTTALAVWKMFDNGKLSDQDLRVALTLLKPKWTMIHSWTRRPAKANLAEMRRRLTAGRKLKAAMHSGKTYDTSAKAKAALKVQWREQGLPTE